MMIPGSLVGLGIGTGSYLLVAAGVIGLFIVYGACANG